MHLPRRLLKDQQSFFRDHESLKTKCNKKINVKKPTDNKLVTKQLPGGKRTTRNIFGSLNVFCLDDGEEHIKGLIGRTKKCKRKLKQACCSSWRCK